MLQDHPITMNISWQMHQNLALEIDGVYLHWGAYLRKLDQGFLCRRAAGVPCIKDGLRGRIDTHEGAGHSVHASGTFLRSSVNEQQIVHVFVRAAVRQQLDG